MGRLVIKRCSTYGSPTLTHFGKVVHILAILLKLGCCRRHEGADDTRAMRAVRTFEQEVRHGLDERVVIFLQNHGISGCSEMGIEDITL